MIPKVVHRVWVGGDEPDWTRRHAETWARPGWELLVWDDQRVRDLFPLYNQRIYDAATFIAPDHVGQLRSDVLRYEILCHFGGVYVDADFECLRPIDDLIEDARAFAAWEEQDVWIANGLMGCEPGHWFLDKLIAGLEENVAANFGYKPNRLSGPQYLTRMQNAHGGLDRVLPQNQFFPYGWNDVEGQSIEDDWGSAYAVHHWANKRRERSCLPA